MVGRQRHRAVRVPCCSVLRAALLGALLLFALFLPCGAPAQDTGKIYKLYLKPYEGLPSGKIIAIEGKVGAAGESFFVEDLNILQPVAVTLLARDPKEKLTIALSKDRWDKPEASGATDSRGQCTLTFRTMGEVKIRVSAEGSPKAYYLIVWAGDEVPLEPGAAFLTMKDYQGRKGGAGE